MYQIDEIVQELKNLAVPTNREGMARFGIDTATALGVSVPKLRAIAKKLGKSHELAEELWKTNIHEARLLATMVDRPAAVTSLQMERWVGDFNSWDLCDQCCSNLFDKTPFAFRKAIEWSGRKEEFVKRAGFALMATLSVHDKNRPDEEFLKFFSHIKRHSTDERNFVKKAVNWALRQIGKRSPFLRRAAIKTAKEIQKLDSKSAKWVAADALRELKSS